MDIKCGWNTPRDPELIYPPSGLEESDLGPWLFDSTLLEATLDPESHDVNLEFSIDFLNRFHRLPDNTVFRMIVVDAHRLEASANILKRKLPSCEDRSRAAVRRWQMHAWRSESRNWKSVTARVGRSMSFCLGGACVQSAEGASVILDLSIGGVTYDTRMFGAALRFEMSDRGRVSLEELLALGNAYWDAYG